MSFAFNTSGQFKYPLESGGELQTVNFLLSGTATSKAIYEYSLTGTGTQSVDLGTVSDAKALLIKVGTATGAASLNVKFNSSLTPVEISPGGFLLLASPAPSSGVESIDLVFTSDLQVSVIVLG